MQILGLITARGGSKGVPGKNIKPLGGKPLLQYSIDAARSCPGIQRLVLSTDDPAIAECGKALGAEVPFMRPEALALDNTPTLPVVQHVLQELAKTGAHFDAVCLLQPTSPFRRESLLNDCITRFIESQADTLITVRKVPAEYNPHWTFEEKQDGLLRISTGEENIIPRRQELPVAWHRDGQVYITLSSVIQNENTLLGKKMVGFDNSLSAPINIDTMEDWYKAEAYINNNSKSL